MTLILMVATFGVLSVLGVACRRARLDLDEQLCECLESPVPVVAAAGFGAGRVDLAPALPVLVGLDGGGEGPGSAGRRRRRRHLRVVEAG